MAEGGACAPGLWTQMLYLQRQNFILPWDKWGHRVEVSTSCCYPKNCTYRGSWS